MGVPARTGVPDACSVVKRARHQLRAEDVEGDANNLGSVSLIVLREHLPFHADGRQTVRLKSSVPVSTSHSLAERSMLPVATSVLCWLKVRYTCTA